MGANHLEQTNALFRKNLVIQRRACKTNCCLILFPLLLCSVIGGLQIAVNRASLQDVPTRLDCHCSNVTVGENTIGGMECPDECPLPRAPKWPPVLQIPLSKNRAVRGGLFPFTDLPDASCRGAGSCAATFLVTGTNQSFVGSVMDNMFPAHNTSVNLSADISALADFVLADEGFFYAPGVDSFLQSKCTQNLTLSFAFQVGNETETRDVPAAASLEHSYKWRQHCRFGNSRVWISYSSGCDNRVWIGYNKGIGYQRLAAWKGISFTSSFLL